MILEGARERERGIDVREKHQLSFICTPTGDHIHNLGMCPDGELNLLPFSVQEDAATNRAIPAGAQPEFLPYTEKDPGL